MTTISEAKTAIRSSNHSPDIRLNHVDISTGNFWNMCLWVSTASSSLVFNVEIYSIGIICAASATTKGKKRKGISNHTRSHHHSTLRHIFRRLEPFASPTPSSRIYPTTGHYLFCSLHPRRSVRGAHGAESPDEQTDSNSVGTTSRLCHILLSQILV